MLKNKDRERKDVRVIVDACLRVVLRKDFHDELFEEINKIKEVSGCLYFDHQVLRNYYRPDFFISSFNTNEVWQDLYWKEYWHRDPIERKVHKNAQINRRSFIIWSINDCESDCMKKRQDVCGVTSGLSICSIKKNGIFETFSMGWVCDPDLTPDQINKIEESIKPLSDHHLAVYQNFEKRSS